MPRDAITTSSAPAAIGPYSQAVRAGNTVYLSGQIPLDPATGELVGGDIAARARRVFENLKAVCAAAGGSMDDVVRVGIYLTDLADFVAVNAVMAEYFSAPYPARSTIQVAGLPKGTDVEVDAVLVLARGA
jgi:reactive intermediate/imine deaminase